MSVSVRGPFTGVLNIVRFNWPFFVAAELLIVAAVVGATMLSPSRIAFLLALVAVGAMFGIALSLVVSHIIYDRSDLYRLYWLPRALRQLDIHDAVFCQTGFDESSALFRAALPAARWTVLDHYDPQRMTEASIQRARRACPPPAESVAAPYDRWATSDASADVVFGILAVHELRTDAERQAWFAEARRTVRSHGRVVIVEHVRDVANVLAFGPGALHFHAVDTWTNNWTRAGLRAVDQFRVTPWVRVFVLEAERS